MSRFVLFIWLLFAGCLLVSRVGVAEDPTPLAPVGEDVAPDADGLTALKVQIVSGARTTLEGAPWVGLSCRLSNRNKAPLMFVGYRSDSFDPPLAKGQISPIYIVELQRNGKWEKHPIGWCGTGMDGIELAAKESNTFGLSVPVDPPWSAVRVGVRWSRPLDYRTAEADAFRTAWSEPLALVDIDEKPVKPSKTGTITHGKPEGHFAAFLMSDRDQWKVDEPISLSHGVICVSLPPAGGDGKQVWWLKVDRPYRAVDPNNGSWFTVTGPDGKELKYLGEYVEWRAAQPEDDVLLRQGEFVGTASSGVEQQFDLKKPGKYRLRWHHGWSEPQLISNEVEIEIVPK